MLKSYVLAPISAAAAIFGLVAVVHFSGISGVVGIPPVKDLTALPDSKFSVSLKFGEEKLPVTLEGDIVEPQAVNRAGKANRLMQGTASAPLPSSVPFYRGPYTFSQSRIL